MDDKISEIIKDLSESIFYIVSTVCLVITTKKKKRNTISQRERGNNPLSLSFYIISHSFPQ